ncbi:hypothetical protein AAMO2058_000964000 [Amorphochlora amoebiformis]
MRSRGFRRVGGLVMAVVAFISTVRNPRPSVGLEGGTRYGNREIHPSERRDFFRLQGGLATVSRTSKPPKGHNKLPDSGPGDGIDPESFQEAGGIDIDKLANETMIAADRGLRDRREGEIAVIPEEGFSISVPYNDGLLFINICGAEEGIPLPFHPNDLEQEARNREHPGGTIGGKFPLTAGPPRPYRDNKPNDNDKIVDVFFHSALVKRANHPQTSQRAKYFLCGIAIAIVAVQHNLEVSDQFQILPNRYIGMPMVYNMQSVGNATAIPEPKTEPPVLNLRGKEKKAEEERFRELERIRKQIDNITNSPPPRRPFPRPEPAKISPGFLTDPGAEVARNLEKSPENLRASPARGSPPSVATKKAQSEIDWERIIQDREERRRQEEESWSATSDRDMTVNNEDFKQMVTRAKRQEDMEPLDEGDIKELESSGWVNKTRIRNLDSSSKFDFQEPQF